MGYIERNLQNILPDSVQGCFQVKTGMDQRFMEMWIEEKVWKFYIQHAFQSLRLLEYFVRHKKTATVNMLLEIGTDTAFISGGHTCAQ